MSEKLGLYLRFRCGHYERLVDATYLHDWLDQARRMLCNKCEEKKEKAEAERVREKLRQSPLRATLQQGRQGP